ncbi:hypothetical protein [Pseudoflavonifractor phocaeensis]|uniref:hypothetical protein n=1 Tax=Pseudoflavonifractor phocaeensis TaxID=1870988 RepID=UPI001F2C4F3F|nr:hypothetical protein [Pseudoflavonifractor phocaeensis]MCF2661842.1 hypothetical protein [Pseudoflavonifractor phocaeensis]
MGDIIPFDQFWEEPDLDAMGREELKAYLAQVRDELARLDEEEPQDMDSEEYEVWGDKHEELEDLADEIWDRLDGE